MAGIETRTRQETLAKWDEASEDGRTKGLKARPTREYLIGEAEIKKESVRLFKKLLMKKPGDNIEIKVYWPGRRGKFDEATLKREFKKIANGKEVIIKAPSTIKQIAILSAKRGKPESISVKTVDRWNAEGFLKGALIIDSVETAEPQKKKSIPIKESSIISSYPLADQDYWNIVLNVARELDSGYANMTLQEIGKELIKRNSNWVRKTNIFGKKR